MQIPIRLLDIEGEGFHVMVKGKINGLEASFLVDTGASRSVFDPTVIARFIENPTFEKKEGITAGVGGNDLESSTFIINTLSFGDIEIHDYEAVALDLENVHETYQKLGLPSIDGIIGGDLLYRLRATINYRLRKIRFTKPRSNSKRNK
ncbi:MAG: retropepsin-like domain-containing protein [Bacteroidales bacterium]|nr:retropepsin-like domain-containing protein [Bacteroidales bacterium]